MNNSVIHNLINGVAVDYLNVNDRSIHYGDGLFETILFSNHKLYYWQQHYQRLKNSAEKLKLNCPDEELLLDDIRQLALNAELAGKHVNAIKIIITRGTAGRGYQFAQSKGVQGSENRIVSLSPLAEDYSSLVSGRLVSGKLYLCNQQVSINKNLAGIKHLNRLENVLARNEWNPADNDIVDGLMLNANRHVIEGSMSNLFAVNDNQLFTPNLELSGVNGVMRNMIIACAKKNSIAVSIVDLTVDELLSMSEIFISNSLIGIKSVNQIEQIRYKEQKLTNILFNDLLKTKNDYAQTV